MNIPRFSVGIGDRFAQEGAAQLRAFTMAEQRGAVVAPVWNKSFREHSLVGTKPEDVRAEADEATSAGGWKHSYFVDADHVGLKTVDGFLTASDFFTLDVADFIGEPATESEIARFVSDMARFRGELSLPGVATPFTVDDALLTGVARQYLRAVAEAGRIYRRVREAKKDAGFVTEVSFDEATTPQSPLELFFILGALSREGVPAQTVAPKFVGKFLKGIDYVGEVATFAREFEAHLSVVAHAVSVFGLPATLKLSVHTGSDKFSLYPVIRRALRKTNAGLHLKTAGTTWLEEVIGLALSGGKGLAIAKRIYLTAVERFDELCRPYATVVEIDRGKLPTPRDVDAWDAEAFARRLRHDPTCPDYDRNLRQLVHVAFKVAAEMGDEFRGALRGAREITARCVTENLYERHLRPLFIDA